MCRNIKPLFNFEPPVRDDEVHAAALQFVRKISSFNKSSKANEAVAPFRPGLRNRGTLGGPENGSALQAAVDTVAAASITLLYSIETNAPPRNRKIARARARNAPRLPVIRQAKN